MEYTLNAPDDIRIAGKTQAYTKIVNGKNKTVDTVLYEKNIEEKSYYVVQAIPGTKAKTLYIVTAFIGKEGYKKEAPQLINAKSLDVTAKTGSVDASTKMIPQDSDSVKRKLSDRDSNSVSNRALLANALESTVQNEIERKAITEYKAELAQADALEQELAGIRSLWRCKKGAFSSCSYAEWKRISSCRHKNTELQNGVSVTKSAVESPISSVSKEMIQQKPNSVVFNLKQKCLRL